MSLPSPKAEAEDDKISLLSTEMHELSNGINNPRLTPKPGSQTKPPYETDGFLSAHLSGPIRPLSPDTLSHLSADEYEQIQPSRQAVHPPVGNPAKDMRGKLQAAWIRNKGLAYMLAAQFFGTLMNVTTRLLEVEGNGGKGLHPFQILFARMGITFVLASTYMWYKKTPHFPLGLPEVRWLLIARGLGGFWGVFGMYYSLLHLPLAEATVITFLAPGLACWACSVLIHEPFTKWDKIGTLVSFIGVLFIARPTTLFQAFGSDHTPPGGGTGDMAPNGNSTALASGPDAASFDNVTPTQRLGAVGISLLGVVGAACAYTTIRWIGKRAHPLITVNYFAAWCTIVSLVMQSFVGFLLPSDFKSWAYLIFLGSCGFVMQFLLAAALSYEKSSRATNMTYTSMLWALAADKLVFDHTPGLLSILGSSLILGSAIVIAMQKTSTSQTKDITQGVRTPADEESQRGLLGGIEVAESGEDHDRLPLQEVELRTLR